MTYTISKLVKPDIQTFIDDVCLILLKLGTIVATGSISFADKHINILFVGLLTVLFLSLALVVKRRKKLMN